jgi:pilus assembly protein CpaF
MIDLQLVHPTKGTRTFSFDKESVMLGRAPGNDVLVEVEGVSRYHARISIEEGQLIVQDLSSTNGTFVNSTRITTAVPLGEGDKVSIGNAIITAKIGDGSGASVGTDSEQPVVSEENITGTMVDMAGGGAAYKPPAADPETHKIKAEPAPIEPKPAAPSQATSDEAKDEEEKGDPRIKDKFFWESLRGFLGPVWKYVEDDAVSEILINGPVEIYIERKGRLERAPESFGNEMLKAAVQNIAQYVGRRISEEEPYMDARLPDGSRVAVLNPPCSRKGISISIRKFSKEALTLDKLMNFGSLSKEMIAYLTACVVLKKNIIVSGGTSSGKTSLLNVVSSLIPSDERILTIEDSAELQLTQDHVLPMETKAPDKKGRGQVTIRDLVRASLRMRPDRIVVGEIRGGEALDLLQAMNTGHSGSMATVHASSPSQALTRLETLSLFSGIEIPMRALREQVSTALDVVIQASRLPDHSRKVTHITEVGSLSADGTYTTKDIFRFKNTGRDEKNKIIGHHVWTGNMTKYLDEMQLSGMQDAVNLFSGGMTADTSGKFQDASH